jgi:predicted peptidase
MKSFVLFFTVCAAAAATLPLVAETRTGDSPRLRQQGRADTVTVPVTINYLEALPAAYANDTTKRWPLVIFLHGSGERGADLKKVAKHGPPKLVEAGKAFPFVLLSPQCPEGKWWDVAALDAWLDEVVRTYRVDADRVYVTGLSMGGYGAWAWAQHAPGRFAAIVPICGGGEPKEAAKLSRLPVWAFHGAKDPSVPVAQTEEMIAAIKEAGGEPRVTVYPEAAHDSWTETYANDEVFAWLLAQRRAVSK